MQDSSDSLESTSANARYLGRELMISVGGLIVLLTLVLSAFLLLNGREELRQQTLRSLDEQTARVADDIDERVKTRLRILSNIAASIQVSEAALTQNPRGLLTHRPAIQTLFDHRLILDTSGTIIFDDPPIPGRRGLNIRDREDFRQTILRKSPIISAPFRTRVGNRIALNINAPLFDSEGRLSGVLVGSLELNENQQLLGELNQRRLGSTGHLSLLSRSGVYLSHPNQSMILKNASPSIRQALESQIQSGWSGGMQGVDENGTPVLLAFRPLTHVDWVLAAEVPLGESYRPLESLQRNTLLLAVLIVPLSFLLLHMLIRKRLFPLTRLIQHIQNQNTFNHSPVVLDEHAAQEVQQIASAFNHLQARQLQIEGMLREREAFFRTLNDGSPFGVFSTDEKGRLIYTNAACERLTGMNSVMLANGGWRALLHEGDRDRVMSGWSTAVKSQSDFESRHRMRHPYGYTLWVDFRARYIGQERLGISFVGTIIDITSEHQALERLEAERERATLILESINDAVLLSSPDLVIEYINPVAEKLLGLTPGKLVGRYLLDAIQLQTDRRQDAEILDEKMLRELEGMRNVDLNLIANQQHVAVEVTVSTIRLSSELHGYQVLVIHDDREKRNKEQEVSWAANHDPLTGLYNRRAFSRHLEHLQQERENNPQSCHIALLDLDHFKPVNDTLGHEAGDVLLKKVAEALRAHIREQDIPARMGGDEFALLLPKCSEAQAAAVLERIRQEIAQIEVDAGHPELYVSTSVGLTEFFADEDISTATKRADEACYAAKHGGRNAVVQVGRSVA